MHLLKVASVLAGCKGILTATKGRHPLAEFACGKGFCALKHHVLQHMGKACLSVGFIDRPRANPDHVQGGWGTTIFIDDDPQPVGKRAIEAGAGC